MGSFELVIDISAQFIWQGQINYARKFEHSAFKRHPMKTRHYAKNYVQNVS